MRPKLGLHPFATTEFRVTDIETQHVAHVFPTRLQVFFLSRLMVCGELCALACKRDAPSRRKTEVSVMIKCI